MPEMPGSLSVQRHGGSEQEESSQYPQAKS